MHMNSDGHLTGTGEKVVVLSKKRKITRVVIAGMSPLKKIKNTHARAHLSNSSVTGWRILPEH